MPVSSSRRRMPSCETASSMPFCSAVGGNSACCRCGETRPSREGPSSSPPRSCPITSGWPNRCISSPSARPTSSRTPTWAKKIAAEAPETWPSAAKATEAAPQSRADPSRTDASRRACGNPPRRLAARSRPARNRFKLNRLRSSFRKWRMILLENRFPLFRIMLQDGGTAVASRVAGVCATGPCACGLSTRGRFQRSRRRQLRRPALVRQRDGHVH